jgi:hypothetical protein
VRDHPYGSAGQGERRSGPGGCTLLPRVGEHPGFTLWRVSLVLVAAMFALAVARVHGLAAWAVLTALVCWCVTWVHAWTALAAAVETWLVETGFGVHRYGELTFGRSDLIRLATVVGLVLCSAVLTRRLNASRQLTSQSVPGGPVSRRRERLGNDR